jgi:hypothetical protein
MHDGVAAVPRDGDLHQVGHAIGPIIACGDERLAGLGCDDRDVHDVAEGVEEPLHRMTGAAFALGAVDEPVGDLLRIGPGLPHPLRRGLDANRRVDDAAVMLARGGCHVST